MQTSRLRLDLTGMNGSLESADRSLLDNCHRERLAGKSARDLEQRLLLPGAPEIAAVWREIIGAAASAGALDPGWSLRRRLGARNGRSEVLGDDNGLSGISPLVGGRLVGADPSDRDRIGADTAGTRRGIGPAVAY